VIGPYYETMIVVGVIALALLSVTLLYHMARYTAKAVTWLVRFTIWASVGVILLILAMTIVLTVLPWIGRVTGTHYIWPISQLYTSTEHRDAVPDNTRQTYESILTKGGGYDYTPKGDEEGYVQLEIDPQTGQRVRLPIVGNRIYRENKAAWRRISQGTLESIMGHEALEWWSTWLGTEWNTWAKLRLAGWIGGTTALSITKSVAQGLGGVILHYVPIDALWKRSTEPTSTVDPDDPFVGVYPTNPHF